MNKYKQFCFFSLILFIAVDLLYMSTNIFHTRSSIDYGTMEKMAELNYEQQLTRIQGQIEVEEFSDIHVNYPCLYGIIPVGDVSRKSVVDGHKYLCGVLLIKGAPIVYSYGSNNNQIFEKALLTLRPDSKIFVFDISESKLPSPEERDARIKYIPLALGGYNLDIKSKIMKTLKEQMIINGHNYIDILKMDIEAAEYEWLKYESDLLIRIGQLSVELHINDNVRDWYPKLDTKMVSWFVNTVESKGLRLFYKEINRMVQNCCSEFSFIQKDWSNFEMTKNYQPKLIL